MKNNFLINSNILLLILVLIASGCNKEFLEVLPKGRLIADKTSDYNALFNSVTSLSPREHTIYLADDICGLLPYYSGNSVLEKKLFSWADDLYEEDENPSMIVPWLNLLYSMNKIVNEVMDSSGGTEAEKKALMAEARVYRAWLHFYFVNLYGRPFHPETAASDPGFPIILTNDLTRKDFERSSVAEVYDFIINELRAAIPDLPTTISNRYRIAQSAGYAYLGKALVFMGNYKEAISALEAAISASNHASIPVGLYDYHVEMESGGAYESGFYGPNVITETHYAEGLHVISQNVASNLIFFPATYFIPKSVQDEFDASDRRRAFWTYTNFAVFTPFPNGIARVFGRTITYSMGATLPDVHLLLAESKAREDDLPGARNLLEAFRKLRMDPADAAQIVSGDKRSLVREIIAERKREFVGMGDRWQTIRRLSVDPFFPDIADYKHIVYDSDGSISEEFKLREERLTLRLPTKMWLENPGMEQNP